MPPPPQPLHRRGFRRSRALWERRDPSWTYYISREFRSALLYELQPFRLGSLTRLQFQTNVQILRRQVEQTCRSLFVTSRCVLTDYVWPLVRQHCTLTDAVIGLGLLVYLYMLRWVHQVLEAGPLVLMVSALVAIFTIGLSDNAASDSSMPSAYAVFNKGFQKLLGSVDADALLQQHVGGGMMAGGMMMMMGGGVGAGREHHHEHHPRGHHPRDAAAAVNDDEEQDDDEALLRRRRPRKKQGNRERNLQRRELQRQRQAAAEHGFGGHNDEQAMVHLVEDAAAGL